MPHRFDPSGFEFEGTSGRDYYSRLHMFQTYRKYLRVYTVPIVLSFSITDFYIAPERAPLWLLLRISTVALVWGAFALMARFRKARSLIREITLGLWTYLGVVFSLIIYGTGGAGSPYLAGMLAAGVSVVLLFHLPKRVAVASQILYAMPIFVAIWLKSFETEPRETLAAIAGFSVIILLTAIGTSRSEQLQRIWKRAQSRTARELEAHRRSEMLKAHFPPMLRKKIEDGRLELGIARIVDNAVVGFADLVGSTAIGNAVELDTDWKLKEQFLSCAASRASECNLVVLNQMGDGILFLANFDDIPDWPDRLLEFHRLIGNDVEDLLHSLKSEIGDHGSGVKLGVARGSIMLGWLGKGGQSYYTAAGAEVNLAARLCDTAEPYEMVLSSRTVVSMVEALATCQTRVVVHRELKGFKIDIHALHISRKADRLVTSGR